MNYIKIYNDLIYRGKQRVIEGYTEIHHIVPKCLGGDDSNDNLVRLTPEEHYVAHQLLVKIHPGNASIINAAIMMIPKRPSNKLYGWLKRLFSDIQSKNQSGDKNSQFGTRWVHNDYLKKSLKISKDAPVPPGWEPGRKMTNWSLTRKCGCCQKYFVFRGLEKYCSVECKDEKTNVFFGREQEFISLYEKTGSMNKALKEMGYPGAISHYYKWAKKVIDNIK